MTITPNSGGPDEHPPTEAWDQEASGQIPEWAPLEPLPSSEMFLATFAGSRPVAASDILDPAFDLVACHSEERLAEAILTDQTSSVEELRVAGKSLVSARTDIAMLVTIIDEAVRERLLRRRRDHPATPTRPSVPLPTSTPILTLGPSQAASVGSGDTLTGVPVHTESVGDIAARMAELWEVLSSSDTDPGDQPEAELLAQLCDSYDGLAAEIEAGRRLPPGL
ncbi:hypothetical protein [Nocardia brasiliensis]|uniref:hypothetical protein n=1 Tax=Nocardia brasiliensis TaxID=37326 RepID=UPI00245812C2|nr:hypothetical protein [Nocardia brasiliensis]